MLGYHFCGATLRDGRQIPADDEWLVHEGRIMPCISGLHMSVEPFDALKYALGPLLCRVELEGEIVPHSDDKFVGRRRRILWRKDITDLLRRFAADQALSVADKWEMPDVVREYLTTLNPDLRQSAKDEVWAHPAAWSVVHPAARSAAWSVAWSVAQSVVQNTALSAARTVIWSAAQEEFNLRVMEITPHTGGLWSNV